ncbi:RHS repeat protein [Pseudomonas cichorii]|uniref:RHS repeat domain-containing protein n=1 Tax=Pseudomonas cichorii TaxID=36746 RepID=UPI0018E6052B|nr:RHS repeat protein [Pseudomonas cichorii]MBI6856214.1 RHS repeat protein [Pseudomonas cichorii]
MNIALHTHTPTLVAVDPRDLAIRNITLYRSEQNQPANERVTRQIHDPAGRLISQHDPRLTRPNLVTIHSLGSQPLLTDSVDAGWRLALLGEAGQAVASWDSRGTQRQIDYDTLLRPENIIEQGIAAEHFIYGAADAFEHNQCNQLIRHDDTAGIRYRPDYGVLGSVLSEARDFGNPAEPVLTTHWSFNAWGETLRQTDAMGHVQHFGHSVAGQLKTVELTLAGATQVQTLVSDIRYNAFDQVEQETAGNGVVSLAVYESSNGLRQSLTASRTGNETLQSLHYSYDPVGNILQIEDRAQPVRFFANQRIEPISRYAYDTLYQLIEATGREVNTGASHGPALPGLQPLPPDPNQVSNYTQRYDYDAAGNLLQMRHVGAQSFTRTMRVAPDSNRSLPEGEVDADLNEAFDANGNLLHLIRGQTLSWDVRNQLQEITTITRTGRASDHERYIYDGQGQRCRKVNSTITSNRTLNNEVRYLPGLEIRTTADGEILHVITARNSRVLHWQEGQPSGIENDQIRYSLNDHLGSSTLELDHQGGLISQESYYPFGGTAWWAARSAVDAKYKTVRYSGKERDASGLYYYGFRYYAPWLQRWINPDPAGDIDGLNLFRFVGNNPIVAFDDNGSIAVFTNNAQTYFIDEALQERLENAQKKSPVHYDFLKSRYFHEMEDQYTISSKLSHRDYKFEDYFENKFQPHKWTFKWNFKHVRAEPVVHADQVAVEQFIRVSTAEGFPNTLPSVIKRSLVINEGVIEVAKKYASGSPELLNAFLGETQNGKSTQRLLNTFNMTATRVETTLSGSSDWNIYVHVVPRELAVTNTEAPAIKPPSRFTVAAVEQPARTSRFSVSPVMPSTSRFTVTPVQPGIDVRRNSKTRKNSG